MYLLTYKEPVAYKLLVVRFFDEPRESIVVDDDIATINLVDETVYLLANPLRPTSKIKEKLNKVFKDLFELRELIDSFENYINNKVLIKSFLEYIKYKKIEASIEVLDYSLMLIDIEGNIEKINEKISEHFLRFEIGEIDGLL